MPSTIEAVRAEALFVSILQSAERPAADRVRQAVASALRREGIRGCAARVALEFGDHPETAVTRMVWALAMVRLVYAPAAPATQPTAEHLPAALALAS